jgi:quercetin dioxygenase-like cupin family protein
MKKKCAVGKNPAYSPVYRHKKEGRWTGVTIDRYKNSEGGWLSITRQFLIGKRGESAKFHLRYFEIEPGGYSSLETHRHEHVVICARGKGRALIGKKSYMLRSLDIAYIGPNAVHQLLNPYDEPFGFFCIVDSKRDKPKPVTVSIRKGVRSGAGK